MITGNDGVSKENFTITKIRGRSLTPVRNKKPRNAIVFDDGREAEGFDSI
jgi:hypothetical protein